MTCWGTKAYGQGVCRYILSLRVVIPVAWHWEEKLKSICRALAQLQGCSSESLQDSQGQHLGPA